MTNEEWLAKINARRLELSAMTREERRADIDRRSWEIFWAGVAHVRQLMKERRETDRQLN